MLLSVETSHGCTPEGLRRTFPLSSVAGEAEQGLLVTMVRTFRTVAPWLALTVFASTTAYAEADDEHGDADDESARENPRNSAETVELRLTDGRVLVGRFIEKEGAKLVFALLNGDVVTVFEDQIRNLDEVLRAVLPPAVYDSGKAAYRVGKARADLERGAARIEAARTGEERAAAVHEMRRQQEESLASGIQAGEALQRHDYVSWHEGNAPHVDVFFGANVGGLFAGDPTFFGLGLSGAAGFAPLNTPGWRAGLKARGFVTYAPITTASAGSSSGSGSPGTSASSTSSLPSKSGVLSFFGWDARLELAGLGQDLRVEAGRWGWSGTASTTMDYPSAPRLNTNETSSLSASGAVVGAFWAPCHGSRNPRCTSRWLLGVERYAADGDLAGSFVAYVLGFVESDMRMSVRFANDIDATRILAEERYQLSNALVARTSGDRDAVHFELNFEMGFGKDFD